MLKEMISHLVDVVGMTQLQISQATGVPQSAISRVYTGSQHEVGYSSGKKIERLYKSVVDNAQKQAA